MVPPPVIVIAWLLAPVLVVVYLAFNGGGFFPGTTGILAVAAAAGLTLRVAFAERPFAGIGRLAAGALVLLGAYALWALLSGTWSDAPARAVLEFSRALLYLLAVALVASFPRTWGGKRLLVTGVAAGIVAVCAVALISRVLPDVWPIASNIQNDRLSYPLTYWNTLGLLGAIGVVLCIHLASSEHEPLVVRISAAGAVPALAAVIFFTFSRGAIAAALLGVLAYLAIGRPRGGLGTLLSVAPPTAVGIAVAYGAELLATEQPTSPGAIEQGHGVALAVALSVIAAAVLRVLLLGLDSRIEAWRPPRIGRRARAGLVTAVLLAGVIAAASVDLPSRAQHELQRFTRGGEVSQSGSLRSRLTDPGNNGRLEFWDVSLDQFHGAWIRGAGAGSFSLAWAKERPITTSVQDGHSLYLETLGELGIVGLLLIGGFVSLLVVGVARGMKGASRPLHAAILSVLIAWALHAGAEWDWEMPALTLPVLCLAGAAIAVPPSESPAGRLPRSGRLTAAVAFLALAVTPLLVAVSQARLNTSVEALKQGDCELSIDAALGSISALGLRPEPYELLSYCDSRLGEHELAISQAAAAIRREPTNWNFWYTLALARAAAGRDPRPAARRALRLNRFGSLPKEAARRFATSSDPREWRKRAQGALLPLP